MRKAFVLNSLETELNDENRTNKKDAEFYNQIYDMMRANDSGYASSSYYANDKVVILKQGETKSVSVTSSGAGTIYWQRTSGSYSQANWSEKWSGSSVSTIFKGVSKGADVYKFTKDGSTEFFRILVIVDDK